MDTRVGAAVRVRVLGGLEIRTADDRDVALPGKKLRALVACLALPPGTPWSRERLTALLWGDRDEEQARASLRQTLAELRRQIGAAALQTTRETIILDAGAVVVDAVEFARLVEAGDLAQAAALYRGDLLDGVVLPDAGFADWLLVERTRLHDLAIDVLSRLVAAQSGAVALETAQRLLQLDPTHEAAHRALMQLHLAQGDRARALRQYQICRDALHSELGVPPEPETEQLYRSIKEERRPPVRMAGPAPASGTSGEASLITDASSPTHKPEALYSHGKPSIAVLPFTNMSGDLEQQYFSDGITEDIITDLSQVSALFVVARNTAFTFKGKAADVIQVAHRLNSAYVLEGSVRKAGNRIRITVQLIDGATGGHVWAERYDRDFGDIFALQDEISKKVVAALKVKLLPEEMAAITSRPTTSAQAYEHYLLGRSLLVGGWGNKDLLRAAKRSFAEAVAVDPGYARAYAGIAECDASLWIVSEIDVSYEAILANSVRALELAPNLPEAHACKGFALYWTGHSSEAMIALERAIDLDPRLLEGNFFYGMACRDTGRFDKAAILLERAAELRPDDYVALGIVADVYVQLGLRDQCISAAKRCLTRIEAALAKTPDDSRLVSWRASISVYLGDYSDAEEWTKRSIVLSPEDYVIQYNAACTYAVIGKPDMALKCLEYIYLHVPRARRWLLGIASHDTQLDSIRGRTDYQDLMKRLEAAAAGPE
jgi:TolB-like protein/DNA-binding SARP family transcriptional activator